MGPRLNRQPHKYANTTLEMKNMPNASSGTLVGVKRKI